jgi:hypothetical protein
MQHSEQINEIAGALAVAQGKMQHASKDAMNPHFGKSYADLASIVDACRAPLSECGISVVQSPSIVEMSKTVVVRTMLAHKSGQWIAGELGAQVADTKPQTVGSAVTYLRRYGLAAMVGIAPDDDDGNAAQGRPATAQPPRQASTRPAPSATNTPKPQPAQVQQPAFHTPNSRDDANAIVAELWREAQAGAQQVGWIDWLTDESAKLGIETVMKPADATDANVGKARIGLQTIVTKIRTKLSEAKAA